MTIWDSEYFFGNKVSDYGLANKRVDYATFAKAFDGVMIRTDFMCNTCDICEWETVQGGTDAEDEEACIPECFQYRLVSDEGADIIKSFTNDPLFYNEKLDVYVWGITHYGKKWSDVLTNIELRLEEH